MSTCIAIFDAIFQPQIQPQILPYGYYHRYEPGIMNTLQMCTEKARLPLPQSPLEVRPPLPQLPLEACKLILSYLLEGCPTAIGPAQLQQIYGITTEQVSLGTDFYKWWFGPDAHDVMLALNNPNHKIRQNWETHYPPVFRPQRFTSVETGIEEPLTLEAAGRLTEQPHNEYHPSRYWSLTETLRQKGQIPAKPSCYIVMRKEILGKGLSSLAQKGLLIQLNTQSQAGYEEENSALDVAFIVFTLHAQTGQRPLGDPTGMEGRWTYSRCAKDIVLWDGMPYPVIVGGFEPLRGAGASGGLRVLNSFFDDRDYIGVAALRKFYGH